MINFNNILELEKQLAFKRIDNFHIGKRRWNSRNATLGTQYLFQGTEEKLNEYKLKLEGKLNENCTVGKS